MNYIRLSIKILVLNSKQFAYIPIPILLSNNWQWRFDDYYSREIVWFLKNGSTNSMILQIAIMTLSDLFINYWPCRLDPGTTFPSTTEFIRHEAKRHRASSWCLAIIIWNTNVNQNILRSILLYIWSQLSSISVSVGIVSIYITYNLPTQSQTLKKP